jgi:glycine cleavage system regulatory protein
MRKVLAIASVSSEHKQLVLKDLTQIFKKIKITINELLQEEIDNNSNTYPLNNYPYISLTIPNY